MSPISDKKIWVTGLVVACPYGEHLESCPARDLRTLPLKERIAAVEAMSDKELEAIVEEHKACAKKREQQT